MQKTIKFGAIFYLCFICFTVNAQKEKVTEKKNIVKINLPALAFKNISVEYERQVGEKSSVSINVHTIPFGTLPFQSTFKNISKTQNVQYDKFKLGSFGVVPEFRYYVGRKGALHGFYIGPFVSISNYKMNLPINYSNNTKTGIFDGKLNAFTGGLQLGTQFRLGNSLTLDWWILGPNYGSANGTLNFTGALTTSDQSDLTTKLEDVKNKAPFKAIKSYSVSSTGASVVVKGPWGGLRGLGFSLGFRF
jgi:hypothetical protein